MKKTICENLSTHKEKNVSNKISFFRNEIEIEKWEHNQLHSSFCLFEKITLADLKEQSS